MAPRPYMEGRYTSVAAIMFACLRDSCVRVCGPVSGGPHWRPGGWLGTGGDLFAAGPCRWGGQFGPGGEQGVELGADGFVADDVFGQ